MVRGGRSRRRGGTGIAVRGGLALIGCATLAIACSHTHAVSDQPSPSDSTRTDGGAADKHAAQSQPAAELHQTKLRSASRKDAPVLATSPTGLLRPEAVRRLQEKLSAKGFLDPAHASDALDGPTEKALRAFQHENNMPATGLPDDATVRKLDLDPKKIFVDGKSPP